MDFYGLKFICTSTIDSLLFNAVHASRACARLTMMNQINRNPFYHPLQRVAAFLGLLLR